MKKLTMMAFIGIFVFLASNAQAQGLKIPKMDLSSQVLGILDNTKGLGLNADQESKLKKDNKSFVDDLMKISGSNASDEDKKASFLGLKNKRTKFLMDLMGSDLFKKYSGQILKGINPLKSKLGLAALAF
ncbi:hypothetical protein OU792_08895 [Algoriphagus sp. NF]|jgi:hypothetical protein|uniref:DUF3347 domain-containing protein n=1 Tax=Algoriphagus marincola TaxID=264027 RepID=A0ABS7N043_9BACT|nr:MULTISPECIES: hypothetical protein [Algoriphagus]MBY5949684.1 hypothetical protein [Algoriphagus marincola]MCR9084613.1 hypothetical protein [Cyclobacteriaceae bacterium]MDE0560098.1 hypothetical protein [Algoriphagus sp. NF]